MRPLKTFSILGAVKPIAKIAKPGVDIAGKKVSDEAVNKRTRQTYFFEVKSLSTTAVTMRRAGNLPEITARPFFDAMILTRTIASSDTPDSMRVSSALITEPPVASMGSRTKTTSFVSERSKWQVGNEVRRTVVGDGRRQLGVEDVRLAGLLVALD